MNIIKLKDVIMPDHMPQAELFNKYLKGRYAYWIQMRYIVSFDHMRHEGYVACEEDVNKLLQKENGTYPRPYGAPCIDVYDRGIIEYVDSAETDRINNTIDFRMKNKYVTDEDITIDELKKFRQWLASEILLMDQTEIGEQKNSYLTEEDTHVMQYYAGNMYDSTIKILSEFGGTSVSFTSPTVSSCGCSHSSDLTSLYTISECDPITIYRTNIYNRMVVLFSSIEFWQMWAPEFIGVFQRYIENIIRLNFPMSTSKTKKYLDCTCITDPKQDEHIDILKRLSQSLLYIKDGEVSGHKNFIKDALNDWSSMLYEKMMW
jgi:hypothetical protein